MNKLTKVGLRVMRRHPGRVLHMSLFAIKHRTAVARGVRVTRRASRLITAVKCGAAHPKVRAEATSAVSALARAGRDIRRVGVRNALHDDQVATQLRQARSHAWNAAATARRPPPRRRLVARTTVAVAGAGALGGAAYAGWRAFSRLTRR